MQDLEGIVAERTRQLAAVNASLAEQQGACGDDENQRSSDASHNAQQPASCHGSISTVAATNPLAGSSVPVACNVPCGTAIVVHAPEPLR